MTDLDLQIFRFDKMPSEWALHDPGFVSFIVENEIQQNINKWMFSVFYV